MHGQFIRPRQLYLQILRTPRAIASSRPNDNAPGVACLYRVIAACIKAGEGVGAEGNPLASCARAIDPAASKHASPTAHSLFLVKNLSNPSIMVT